jgi:hypothetical protein
MIGLPGGGFPDKDDWDKEVVNVLLVDEYCRGRDGTSSSSSSEKRGTKG